VSYLNSSGAIDLQINGALGVSFNQLTADNHHLIPDICKFLWRSGVSAFLPTLITTSTTELHRSMSYWSAYVGQTAPDSAQVLGLHLEGPFLNPAKRGAHPLAHLQPLNLDTVKQVLGDYGSLVKLITLAPELDPETKVIPWLCDRQIIVSLGHSLANAEETTKAIEGGAKLVTHIFNAMPALHHRQANLLTEALLDDRLYCGVIADGVHVHPRLIGLLLRLKPERLFLVSDALAPLGLGDGTYPWDERQITISQGTARLADGTLAGTTCPLWQQALNLVQWGLCDLRQAVSLVTTVPQQILGLELPNRPQGSISCSP
jgi:N-acetylglucosamine-6-phosphate deacetylase